MTVFIYNCWYVWYGWCGSSVNSKSTRCMQFIHCTPCFSLDVDVFIMQSITRKKRNGDSKYPFLTLVFSFIASVSCPPWMTLYCSPSYKIPVYVDNFLRFTIVSKKFLWGSVFTVEITSHSKLDHHYNFIRNQTQYFKTWLSRIPILVNNVLGYLLNGHVLIVWYENSIYLCNIFQILCPHTYISKPL